ncbi:VanZ family protein [Clostridium sp. ZS2-4]|uniref:VanZ family protein n=1 Tax=Clostridium sp. ZS2-4 TaxID=2987703 RepID=UPI00227C4E7D|nr:VanZ family protein [Clostridium sp. ZS2-4]MCY6354324.1 VanZ family protein [Clostridium sp. ZS2-4]
MGYSIKGELMLVIGIPIYLVVFAISIFKKYKMNIKISWIRELVKFIFVLYVFLLLGVTLFPLSIGFKHSRDYFRLPINLIPFKEVVEEIGKIGTDYGGDVAFQVRLILRNVGGNLILLLPLGVISPIIWEEFTRIKRVIIQGFIVSICIELLQLIEILSGRAFVRAVDIDDVILNVLGVIIGYLIYRGIFYLSNKYDIKFMINIFAERTKEQQSDESYQHQFFENN